MAAEVEGLKRALASEFAGRVPPPIVARVVDDLAHGYDEARITQFVSVLLTRRARAELRQLADQ